MEETGNMTYETHTNLLSCEDVVSYLWNKCNKRSTPFKPEGAVSFEDKVTFTDQKDGDVIKKMFSISHDDWKLIKLKKEKEYDVDNMEFKTFDENKKMLSEGNLLVIYLPIEKVYYVFLHNENEVKLLIKCIQKKKLFESFPTETLSFF